MGASDVKGHITTTARCLTKRALVDNNASVGAAL